MLYIILNSHILSFQHNLPRIDPQSAHPVFCKFHTWLHSCHSYISHSNWYKSTTLYFQYFFIGRNIRHHMSFRQNRSIYLRHIDRIIAITKRPVYLRKSHFRGRTFRCHSPIHKLQSVTARSSSIPHLPIAAFFIPDPNTCNPGLFCKHSLYLLLCQLI